MRIRIAALGIILPAFFSTSAAGQTQVPYATVKPILEAFAEDLPPELKDADAAKWIAWARLEDRAIRARVGQGDLDSMVNLLLFGTSFTKKPRLEVRQLLENSDSPALQSRLHDFVDAIRAPGRNERLLFLRSLLKSKGMNPDTPKGYQAASAFVVENLTRVLREQVKFAQRIAEAKKEGDPNEEFIEQSRLFRDRGVSLDTSLLPNYGIEEALRDMKNRGLFRVGQVTRVAVIGPGLDFADKESGYDYYPQQTLQPFALYDSLLRLGLAKAGALEVTVFDISARSLDHLRMARERAKAGTGYVLQLPRDPARKWLPGAVRYWQAFGDQSGVPATSIQPPPELKGLETRAVRIRPEVVLSAIPKDLDIVFDRLDLPPAQRFDLVIATNVFVYYDNFEQTLALQNVSSMLKPGGFFLTNNNLLALPAVPMKSAGYTTVQYGEGETAGDHMVRYRRE